MMGNGRAWTLRYIALTALIAAFVVVIATRSEAISKTDDNGAVIRLDLRLSHATHIRFISTCNKCAKKDCTNCHILDKKTGRFSLDETACTVCHVPSRPKAWNVPGKARPLDKIKLKHTSHVARANKTPLPCVECHASTMKDVHPDNTPAAEPDACFSCHAEEKVGVPQKSCSRCHEGTNKAKVLPSGHTATWRKGHGELIGWRPAVEHGQKCTQCHGQTACISCHRVSRPVSHNGLWRERLHGKEASWDRDRCKTCHETGACISCHRRTPPLNHRGDWVSNHGRVSGFEEGCTTCHSVTWCRSCHAGQRR